MDDKQVEQARLDIDKVASIVCAYYSSLLANGINSDDSLYLTEKFQDLWIRKTLNIPPQYVIKDKNP